jgi:hypothetical protein
MINFENKNIIIKKIKTENSTMSTTEEKMTTKTSKFIIWNQKEEEEEIEEIIQIEERGIQRTLQTIQRIQNCNFSLPGKEEYFHRKRYETIHQLQRSIQSRERSRALWINFLEEIKKPRVKKPRKGNPSIWKDKYSYD